MKRPISIGLAIFATLGRLIAHFERLRQQSLRWPIATLYLYEVSEYERKAASGGFSFEGVSPNPSP